MPPRDLGLELLVAALVCGVALWCVASEAATKRSEAVAYITEARDVHVRWIEQIEECEADCEALVERVGSVEHHVEWVRRYDVVLEVLGGT